MTDPKPDVPTLRRLLTEATPGPWVHSDVLPGHVYARRHDGDVIVGAPRNVACAAAAVNALPGILDRLEAAEGAVARVESLADELAHPDTDLIVAFERAIHRNIARDLRAALAEVTP